MKPTKITICFLLVVSALALSSCSSSSSNPASAGEVVVVGGDLMNHTGLEGTILKADLLFDGSVIASASFTQPSLYATLTGTLTSVKSGSHTVEFRITSQSSSPNTYDVIGATVNAGTSAYNLGNETASLATGQSISYTVSF